MLEDPRADERRTAARAAGLEEARRAAERFQVCSVMRTRDGWRPDYTVLPRAEGMAARRRRLAAIEADPASDRTRALEQPGALDLGSYRLVALDPIMARKPPSTASRRRRLRLAELEALRP